MRVKSHECEAVPENPDKPFLNDYRRHGYGEKPSKDSEAGQEPLEPSRELATSETEIDLGSKSDKGEHGG